MEADDLAKKLRDAGGGGGTPTTLLFQIKGEEKRKAQSAKAIEQFQKQIADEEEEILKKRLAIQKLYKAVERHEERLETSERRLVYLAAQKHSESIPLVGVAELRTAASLLAARRDEAMSPILALLATLIPPETHDLEEGDTSDARSEAEGRGDDDATEEEMDEDGPSKNIDWANFDGAYSQRLREARDDLQREQRDMLAAVDAAREAKREGNKRSLGGDGPKEEDLAGDVGMVPNLTPAQVEDAFRGRIKEAADRYRHLQQLAAKEMVGGADGKQQPQHQQHAGGGPSQTAEASQRAARRAEEDSGNHEASARDAAHRPPPARVVLRGHSACCTVHRPMAVG